MKNHLKKTLGISALAIGILLYSYIYIKVKKQVVYVDFSGNLTSQNQRRDFFKSDDEESKKAGKNLEKILKEEKNLLGRVDPDPKASFLRLKTIAENLETADLNLLKIKALDESINGDERFLSIYLLAYNGKDISLDSLQNIALSLVPAPESQNQGLRDLEIQIRAQAIEGLSRFYGNERAKAILEKAAEMQNEAFLRDRANRALYSWRTQNSIENQDKTALEKLLYKK